jgi:hypothetical protein
LLLPLAVVALLAVAFLTTRDNSSDDETDLDASARFSELRLERAECTQVEGGLQVHGSVINLSGTPLNDVAVVGLFQDPAGNTVARALGVLTSEFPNGESRDFSVSALQEGLFGCAVSFYLPSGRKLTLDESVIP